MSTSIPQIPSPASMFAESERIRMEKAREERRQAEEAKQARRTNLARAYDGALGRWIERALEEAQIAVKEGRSQARVLLDMVEGSRSEFVNEDKYRTIKPILVELQTIFAEKGYKAFIDHLPREDNRLVTIELVISWKQGSRL